VIKEIAIFIVILVAAILLLAATRPGTFQIQRATLIQATPDALYAILCDFGKFAAWSPWEQLDPLMKRSCSGLGQGAVYEWDGNRKAGAGRMEITQAIPASRVAMQLDFLRPFKCQNTATFTLDAQAGATLITWTMAGSQLFIGKLMGLFVNMDRMVGRDFECGLANLKALAEGDTGIPPRASDIPATSGLAQYLPIAGRILLGLLFLVTGLNGFLNFLPQPKEPMPEAAAAFAGALMKSGYLFRLVMATQLASGLLLLSNRFVPLALALLAPVVVNILAFHLFLAPTGLGVAIIVLLLELYLAWTYRQAFRPMLVARVRPGGR